MHQSHKDPCGLTTPTESASYLTTQVHHAQHAYSLQEVGLNERDVATALDFYVDWLEERMGIRLA